MEKNTDIENLAELFAQFPGIGKRQSKRFVYFILSRNEHFVHELLTAITRIRTNVRQCDLCYRYFDAQQSDARCQICTNKKRDDKTLLIVEKDADIESLEKSGAYKGLYFVLGGLIPVADAQTLGYVRLNQLKKRVEQNLHGGITEIILAFSLTAGGDHTDTYVRNELEGLLNWDKKIPIRSLGRGLSTGTELEYSDSQTLTYALQNRN